MAVAVADFNAGLTFMAPRTLEPVPVPQLVAWGLHGLTAIDPRLDTEQTDEAIRLHLEAQVIGSFALPQAEDIGGWAHLAGDICSAAFGVSPVIRQAGTTGVVHSFFDEVFNHLDPYSRYEAPEDAGEARDRRGYEAGGGLTLGLRGGAVIVREATGGGPAALAGIRAGDRIVAVDGQSVAGQTLETVIGWIDGPDQSSVTLTWQRGRGKQRDSELKRAMVPPESVFVQRAGSIEIIRITNFNSTTAGHTQAALEDALLPQRHFDGLVLDLRGNRGGLLRQSIEVADLFLPEGVIAVTAGRDPSSSHVWRSANAALAPGLPVVVLVDGRTASAAEILAAALADRGRAVVVGSSTLGKGLVQAILPMPDGGELFVTWSRVLAPLGWPLQGLGVMPQVCTSVGTDDIAQEKKSLEAGVAPMEKPVASERAARLPIPAAQIVALRAPCPAAEGRDQDTEVAQWLIAHPAAYATALLPPVRQQAQP